MAIRTYNCTVCGKAFGVERAGRPPKTCSPECALARTQTYYVERHKSLYVPHPRDIKPCLVAGCPKPVHTLGYCSTHAARFKKHGTADQPEIMCPDCGKPSGKFGYRKMRCRPCSDAYKTAVSASRARARVAADPVGTKAQRRKNRLAKYELTEAEMEAMFARQSGRCAICRIELDLHSRDTHIDHCHTTGVVRGLLCGPCNRGLGTFKDDPARLRSAADYIDRHAHLI